MNADKPLSSCQSKRSDYLYREKKDTMRSHITDKEILGNIEELKNIN